jgi:actin-related protein
MFNGGENVEAIVADIGFSNARVGFAGEDTPRFFSTSHVGVACSLPSTNGGATAEKDKASNSYFVGRDALCRKSTSLESVEMSNPIGM